MTELRAEAAEFDNTVRHPRRRRPHLRGSMVDPTNPGASESESDDNFVPDSDSDSNHSVEKNDKGSNSTNEAAVACCLLLSEVDQIRECIANVSLPSWIQRPPVNLGEKTHGRLKADHWYTLFAVILPLILVELWTSPDGSNRESQLLSNFHDLVACTNIACAYSTSNSLADTFMGFYKSYRSLRRLYSHMPDPSRIITMPCTCRNNSSSGVRSSWSASLWVSASMASRRRLRPMAAFVRILQSSAQMILTTFDRRS